MRKEVKDKINKRKIAYVYLLHRMFEGNPTSMLRTMCFGGITVGDLEDWNTEFKDAVYKVIEEEDSKGVRLRDKTDIPSIKSIKERVLRRCNTLIDETTDPAKLATVYKILSEFEVTDERKEKSVLDAINETIKPLTPKKKAKTMVDRMREQRMRSEGIAVPEEEGKNEENEEPEEEDEIIEDEDV